MGTVVVDFNEMFLTPNKLLPSKSTGVEDRKSLTFIDPAPFGYDVQIPPPTARRSSAIVADDYSIQLPLGEVTRDSSDPRKCGGSSARLRFVHNLATTRDSTGTTQ
jgi:hypothetical protein